MKRVVILITTVIYTCFLSCSTDDSKPLVVSTTDLTVDITDDTKVGAIIGTVPGRSNRGALLTYSIVSQTPNVVLDIDAETGDLIVKEALDFESSPQIMLEVNVQQDNVSKISNVIVNVAEGAPCPTLDISFWDGNVAIFNPFFGTTKPGVATTGECAILTIESEDPFDYFCSEVTNMKLQLLPSEDDSKIGTVVAVRQKFICANILEMEATGTYNLTTGIILLNYIFYDESGKIILEDSAEITKS